MDRALSFDSPQSPSPFSLPPYPLPLSLSTQANMDGPFRVLILWLLPLHSTNSMRLYPRYPLLAPAFLIFILSRSFVAFYVTLCESIHDVSCPKHFIARPGNWEKRGVVCIGLNLDAAPSLQVIFLVFIV